jgi:hypothetical protein
MFPPAPRKTIVIDLSVLTFVLPAVLTGLASWIASQRMARSNEKIAAVKRADDDRRERVNSNLSHADDLTQRFKVLMDGYESRISDLTAEVKGLRTKIDEMSMQLKRCSSCPYFRGHDGTD